MKVKRESLMTAAHEAAIFGPKEGFTVKTKELERVTAEGNKFKDGSESPHRTSEERDPNNATPVMDSVLSAQVMSCYL